jgi:hypothetical protein
MTEELTIESGATTDVAPTPETRDVAPVQDAASVNPPPGE